MKTFIRKENVHSQGIRKDENIHSQGIRKDENIHSQGKRSFARNSQG
jgi:hypothetical protein